MKKQSTERWTMTPLILTTLFKLWSILIPKFVYDRINDYGLDLISE